MATSLFRCKRIFSGQNKFSDPVAAGDSLQGQSDDPTGGTRSNLLRTINFEDMGRRFVSATKKARCRGMRAIIGAGLFLRSGQNGIEQIGVMKILQSRISGTAGAGILLGDQGQAKYSYKQAAFVVSARMIKSKTR